MAGAASKRLSIGLLGDLAEEVSFGVELAAGAAGFAGEMPVYEEFEEELAVEDMPSAAEIAAEEKVDEVMRPALNSGAKLVNLAGARRIFAQAGAQLSERGTAFGETLKSGAMLARITASSESQMKGPNDGNA